MTFGLAHIEAFKEVFSRQKTQIRHFPGCTYLTLWQDSADPCLFFTMSRWNHESDLEDYRRSDLFIDTWSTIKPWFSSRPEAWTILNHVPVH